MTLIKTTLACSISCVQQLLLSHVAVIQSHVAVIQSHVVVIQSLVAVPVKQTAVHVLQAKHVTPQVSCENYVCLWVGCKVYARTSCSRSWLERHVLSHGGNKPFRCIVDGCGQRFSSQVCASLYKDFLARIECILLKDTFVSSFCIEIPSQNGI